MPGPAGFFARRWRAEVPLRMLFWRDMVLVGTLISLTSTAVAFAMLAAGATTGWAVAVHFLPLPYNLFLVAALWRQSGAAAYRWAALVWLAFVTLV